MATSDDHIDELVEHFEQTEHAGGLTRSSLLRKGAGLGLSLGLSGLWANQAFGHGLLGSIADKPKLAPFKTNVAAGSKPDLPRRVAWANVSDAEFFMAITRSIKAAASDRDLDFITAIANNNSSTNIDQMNTFLQRGIAALSLQPLDAAAQGVVMKKALGQGIAVMSLVTPPSTVQAVANQYQVGHAQGLAAAKYIKDKLGGKANVLYMNLDSIQVLIARHKGVLDGVKSAGSGVKIVADIEPKAITQQAGFDVMNTVLQSHPEVNVVLGGDTLVLGALSALQAAGKADPKMYLSGIDGDAQALSTISKGKSPYKASFAFAYNLMGYAWGQYAADWLDGKSIPKVMVFNPIELNSAGAIKQFNTDMANVRKTWNKRNKYFTNFGNINYDTRKQFITYAA
jgi:ribose transport system substrate-binding protein